ncbi:MAG: hypothetical protein KIS79_12120 [Burkholderiales bacterium]|nr:hypothetical protein [Burkholderiales bacterium]
MRHPGCSILGALVLLLAGACTTTPKMDAETESASAQTLENMQQAAVDFSRARDAGDALEMGRAAAARRPFDHLTRAPGFLNSDVMFEEARRLADGNGRLLAQLGELESQASGPFPGIFGQFMDRMAGRCKFERDTRSVPPVPQARLPTGGRGEPPSCVLTVGPKTSVQLRADVRARRTLFVYVESQAGADLALTIVDPAITTPVCSQAQPNGYQVCKWRPDKAATGIVEIRNHSDLAVPALLITRQS